MSVVKTKRNLSRFEFYNVARQIRENLTNFLLRDFGVRTRVYKQVTDDNSSITTIEEFPPWLIEFFRASIINTASNLMNNIIAANSIYPINMREVEERRVLQDMAIANCEQLFQTLIYCSDVLPVSLLKFEPYANLINKEIALLKGWRKTTNEFERKIKSKI